MADFGQTEIMTPQQLNDAAVGAHRLSPQQKAELKQRLLGSLQAKTEARSGAGIGGGGMVSAIAVNRSSK